MTRFGNFAGISESLTSHESGKKESARLRAWNRRMLAAMTAIPQTSCERVHLMLTVALLAACAANMLLVCSWL
jgi:hypothetical protein